MIVVEGTCPVVSGAHYVPLGEGVAVNVTLKVGVALDHIRHNFVWCNNKLPHGKLPSSISG